MDHELNSLHSMVFQQRMKHQEAESSRRIFQRMLLIDNDKY